MRFLLSISLLFVVTQTGCSSTHAGHLTADGGTFSPHVPSKHLATAPSCTSHADAGTSDACTASSDCASGKACMCGDDLPGNAVHKANVCVQAQCRTDADCGAGGYCSPSVTPMCASGTNGYFCHTPNDECDDDTDCPDIASCTWTGSSFTCQRAQCAG